MDPVAQIGEWLAEATAAGVYEPNAMSVATAAAHDGRPDVRTVLLKGVDHGLVFFTNYRSAKGRALEANPYAAVSLTWPTEGRQIRARGPVERITDAESDDYFATRARPSQIAAWASPQSEVIGERATLEARVEQMTERFAGADAVPRPPHWGGFRVIPDEVEFWTRRDNRLHDRLRYTRTAAGPDSGEWRVDRLAP